MTRRLSRNTSIERCPSVQTNVHWPCPVDQRLNELLEGLTARGLECTRSQLLAALVLAARPTPTSLERIVRSYRMATAGDVVLQTKGPIVLAERKPGRRPR